MKAGSPEDTTPDECSGAEVANSLCSGRDSVGGASDYIEGYSSPCKVYYPSQLTFILVGAVVDGIGTTYVPTACRRFSSANTGLSP